MSCWSLLLVIAVAAAAAAAPAKDKDKDTHPLFDKEREVEDVVYDQRQNGTENLHISLSDVMVVVAPAESLTPLAMDAFNFLALGAATTDLKDKDKLGAAECGGTGARCRSAHAGALRSKLKLSALLQPLINKHLHRK